MKRSKVVEIIAGWGDDSIRNDIYCCDLPDIEVKQKQLLEWADNLLYVIEEEIGMYPPDTVKEGHTVSEWDRENE